MNYKKKYVEGLAQIQNLHDLNKRQSQKIIDLNAELDKQAREFFEIEQNKNIDSVLVRNQDLEFQLKHFKSLFEKKESQYNELLEIHQNKKPVTNTLLEKRLENKEKRQKEYQHRITEIIAEDSKIKTKDLILLLKINNKTFYNLKLNDYLKSLKLQSRK